MGKLKLFKKKPTNKISGIEIFQKKKIFFNKNVSIAECMKIYFLQFLCFKYMKILQIFKFEVSFL